jgi:hypothetical protein
MACYVGEQSHLKIKELQRITQIEVYYLIHQALPKKLMGK